MPVPGRGERQPRCGGIRFGAGYRRRVHAGWKSVYGEAGKEEDIVFPSWEPDEVLPVTDISVRSVETSPEPLFTEASLLSEMENRGLGTPSTRAVSSNCSSHAGMSRGGDAICCRPPKGWRCMKQLRTS